MIAYLVANRSYNWDYFAHRPSFKVAMRDGQQTLLGKIMTILLTAIIVVLFVMFSQEMIFRNNPRVVHSQSFVPIPEIIEFQPSTNQVAFGLASYDDWSPVDSAGIYKVLITIQSSRIVDKDYIIERVEVQAELCTIQKHFKGQPQVVLDFFENIEINKFYCFPDVFQIGGNSDISDYYNIYLSFQSCSGPDCKSVEEISQALQQTYLSYYTTTTTIDQSNSENPFTKNVRYIWGIATLGLRKHMSVIYSQNQVSIDKGFLVEDISNQKAYSLQSYSEMSVGLNKIDEFYLVNIEMGNQKNKYFFNYQKIQEVFADVQGISDIVIALLLLISPIFSKKPYYNLIGSNIFTFDQTPINNSQTNPKEVGQTQIYPVSNNRLNFSSSESEDNKEPDKRGKILKSKSNLSELFKTDQKLVVFQTDSQDSLTDLVSNSHDKEKLTITNLDSTTNLQQKSSRNDEKKTFNYEQRKRSPFNPILIGTQNDREGLYLFNTRKSLENGQETNFRILKQKEREKNKEEIKQLLIQKIGRHSQIKEMENIKLMNANCKMAQAAEEEIDFSCDILRILQVIYDLDLLQRLILPPDIYNLFPYIDNQKLRIKTFIESPNFTSKKIQQEQQCILRAFTSFQKTRQEEQYHIIHDLLKPEIADIFKQIEKDINNN